MSPLGLASFLPSQVIISTVVSFGPVGAVGTVMSVFVFPTTSLRLLPLPPQRVLDVFLLLVYHESLHRVVIVVVFDQELQLPFFLQQRPGRFLLPAIPVRTSAFAPTATLRATALPPCYVLPANFAFLGILVVARLVPCMVYPNESPANLSAPEVVDGQVGATLVLVLQPSEALRLARLLIANHLEEDGFAKLREYGDDVAFGELVRKTAKVNVGRVSVVDMPGGFRGTVGRLVDC